MASRRRRRGRDSEGSGEIDNSLLALGKDLVNNSRIIKKNTASYQRLTRSLDKTFNIVDGLSEAFDKSEKLQLQSLSMGTTYQKFQEANTKALEGNMTSQQEMTKYLLTGFDRGLRDMGSNTLDLIDEMHITGQNVNGLLTGMSKLSLLTGNSGEIQESLSKTIDDTTKKYGISNDSLIKALGSFSHAMKQQSLYGADAVEGISELGLILKGGVKFEGSEQMIGSLLGMGEAMNIVQQEQLGLRPLFQDIRDGVKISDKHLQMIVTAGDSLNSMMGENDISRDAIATMFGKEQVTSLLMISENLKSNNILAADMKKTAEDNLKSRRAFEEKKMAFYETFAPEIHGAVTKWLPLIVAARGAQSFAAPGLRKAGLEIATSPYGGRMKSTLGRGMMAMGGDFTGVGQSASKAATGMRFGRLLGGLGRFAAVLGPVGIGISALSFGVPMLVKLFKSNVDNTKAVAEEARKKKQLRARANIATEAQLASNLMRSFNARNPDANEGKDMLRVMKSIDSKTGNPPLKKI